MSNERITYTYTPVTGFLSRYIFQWFGIRLAAQNTGKYNFLNRKYAFFTNILPMSGFNKKVHREWFHSWFQDLNDNPNRRKLFHFRGSISKRSIKDVDESKDIIRYELCSERLTRVSLKIRQSGDYRNATYFNFSILGVSAYITLPWLPYPKFLQKYILIDAYTYDGEFKWNFLTLVSSEYSWSSSDPKLPFWRKFSFNPKNFFLGDNIHFAKELAEIKDAMFSIDDTVYMINKIIFKKRTWFRSRIPYFLNNSSVTGAEIKIDKPPMHQGKGSTSYNCGDDGTYGMTVPWQPTMPRITMFGREEHNKLAEVVCREYYNHYMKDVKKRGAVNHKYLAPFKYIGTREYLKMIEGRKNKELAERGEVSDAKNVTNQVPMLDDSMDSNAQKH